MQPKIRFIHENSVGLHGMMHDPNQKKWDEWRHDFKLKYNRPYTVRAIGLAENDLTDEDLERLVTDLELNRFINLRYIDLGESSISRPETLLNLPSKPFIHLYPGGLRRARGIFRGMADRGVDIGQCDKLIFLSDGYYLQAAANQELVNDCEDFIPHNWIGMHMRFYELDTKIQYDKYLDYLTNTAFWRYGPFQDNPDNFRNSSEVIDTISYSDYESSDSEEETILFIEDELPPEEDDGVGLSYGQSMKLTYGAMLMDRPNKIKDMVYKNLNWFETLPVYRVHRGK